MAKWLIWRVVGVALALALVASCSFNPSDEEWRFIGTWEDDAGERWVFRDDGTLDISAAPVSLDWKVKNERLEVKSIFRVFYIEAIYSFVTEDEVELTIEDSSALASGYETGAGSQYSLYRQAD
jgi:hypothetical protein